jgi:hypothetical protein
MITGRSALTLAPAVSDICFMTAEDRIATLEAQISKLREDLAGLRRQFAKAELDHWQGRIEDAEVQVHFGAAEASDRLAKLADQLRDKWADARRHFEESISTASSVADSVRAGLASALADLRKALLESKSKPK